MRPYLSRTSLSLTLIAALSGCSGEPPDDFELSRQALERTPVQSQVVARIDWSMPPTINGDDPNDPTTATTRKLNQTDFTVVLNGCASTPESWGQLTRFEWRLSDGVRPDQTIAVANNCSVPVQMKQGTHRVKLIATSAAGFVGEAVADVIVRNYLIVSIGDSVASGEGNPDTALPNLAWANARCHRSLKSGPAKAARALEEADPRSSVTFASFACSGASINKGLLAAYDGVSNPNKLPPLHGQVDAVAEALCPNGCPNGMRTVDALLISVGANDVGFSDIVKACGYPFRFGGLKSGCNDDKDLNQKLSNDLAALPAKYAVLNTIIRNTLHPRSVFISEYFNPDWYDVRGGFRSEGISLCLGMTFKDAGPGGIDGLIDNAEVVWAENHVIAPINAAVAAAAKANGWTLVDGIANDFATGGHGYCAGANSWITAYDQSFAVQGDERGTMHPNGAGQDAYARRISASVSADFTLGHRETDFDRNGTADILWYNTLNGALSAWFLGNSSTLATDVLATSLLDLHVEVGSGWQVAATADFDGDGTGDVLWRLPSTGQLFIWYMQGSRQVRSADVAPNDRLPASTGWEVVGTGDFNRDGNLDLLWHNEQTGQIVAWLLDNQGTHIIGRPQLNRLSSLSSGWKFAGTADFDGDGATDLLWYEPTSGSLVFWRTINMFVVADVPFDFAGPNAASGWKIVGLDDFNGDGTADVLWNHPSDGTLVVWNMQNGRFVSASGLVLSAAESTGWQVVSR